VAKRWINENEVLVKLLSHSLRMILSHEYARGLVKGEMMRKEEGSELLFTA
jgi:hypothetical protein